MTESLTSFESELDRTGKIAFTNVGVSMRPLLREGKDVMLIRKISGVDAKRWDAVLFRRPGISGRGAYVLHRILKQNADGSFWIVGDNCTDGENVLPQDILGVLQAVQRNGKTLQTTDLSYRLYLRFWCRPYHFRIFCLKIARFFRWAILSVKQKLSSANKSKQG